MNYPILCLIASDQYPYLLLSMKPKFENCGYIEEYAIKTERLEKSRDGKFLLLHIPNEITGLQILAHAICTMDGNFILNRFGDKGYAPSLPREIKQMFNRHIITEENQLPMTLIEKILQWFKKSTGGPEIK